MRVHRYDSGSTPPLDAARQLGRDWSAAISTAAAGYREHYRLLGIDDPVVRRVARSSLEATAAWWPSQADRLVATAEGAGIPTDDIAMLTARTEVLAAANESGPGECSTLVDLGSSVAFQTWDWHPQLVPEALWWRSTTADGQWVKTFTEPGMPAKIGLNSAGLSVNFNILHHTSDSSAGGVPVHVVARRILEEARTVDDACELARSAPVSASSVITVLATFATLTTLATLAAGNESPAAAAIEISPAGVAAVEPAGEWLVHTNHFLDPQLRAGGVIPPLSTSAQRFEHLAAARPAATTGLAALADQLCGTSRDSAPICMKADPSLPPTQRWQTLLSVRLEPRTGRVEYWPGTPYDAVHAGPCLRF
ncbi:isopenicillin-N N-acyltransferase-like protein [Kribbella aluminosa]|uniref:Isopenicillin-N N-acyltransferase-like protein n=1 Tax=Kribbella aluminosa TaxID=416017 RepID=A0ABS4UK12_9ACTN|nr:C45 family peptidase [Kribbella aluminosa]MBP2351993.1 isopenicillin-N N-acyltransferase-like protein [Kribbella aluminosa]